MRTRKEKWRVYRERIKTLPDDRFPTPKVSERPLAASDHALIETMGKSKNMIRQGPTLVVGEKGSATPYSVYEKRKKQWLLVKGALLLLAIAFFIILWFCWVAKA
jgi:hypothetical protein